MLDRQDSVARAFVDLFDFYSWDKLLACHGLPIPMAYIVSYAQTKGRMTIPRLEQQFALHIEYRNAGTRLSSCGHG